MFSTILSIDSFGQENRWEGKYKQPKSYVTHYFGGDALYSKIKLELTVDSTYILEIYEYRKGAFKKSHDLISYSKQSGTWSIFGEHLKLNNFVGEDYYNAFRIDDGDMYLGRKILKKKIGYFLLRRKKTNSRKKL